MSSLDELIRSLEQRAPVTMNEAAECIDSVLETPIVDGCDLQNAVASLDNVAVHALNGQRFEIAQHALSVAGRTALRGLSDGLTAQVVRVLAKRMRDLGHLDSAIELLEFAVEIARTLPSNEDLVTILNLQGDLLRQAGKPNRGAHALTEAIEVIEADSSISPRCHSVVLNNLGLIRIETGVLDEAAALLERSLEIDSENGASNIDLAITIDNLGAVEIKRAKANGPLHLGEGYVNEFVAKHLRQAERFFTKANATFADNLPKSAPDYVNSLLNLADHASLEGDEEKLEKFSKEAVEAAINYRVASHVRWTALNSRAVGLVDQQRFSEIVQLVRPWYERDTPRPDQYVSSCIICLAEAASATGDQALAVEAASVVASIDTQLLSGLVHALSEVEARYVLSPFFERTERIIGCCIQFGAECPDWIYDLLLQQKGILSEKYGATMYHGHLPNSRAETLASEARRLRAYAASLDLDGARMEFIRDARRSQREAWRSADEAQMALLAEVGSHAPEVVRLDDVRSRVARDSIFIDIAVAQTPTGDRNYVAFTLHASAPLRCRSIGSVKKIDSRIRELHETIKRRGEDWQELASELASRLFGNDNVCEFDSVLISPTGYWNWLPYDILLLGQQQLVSETVLTCVPSGRWLALHRPRDRQAPLSSSVVIGDPDFDGDFTDRIDFFLRQHHAKLHHTRAEAVEVAKLLEVKPTLGAAATRSKLIEASRPRILHLATHGSFLEARGSFEEQREPTVVKLESVAGVVVQRDIDLAGHVGKRSGGTEDLIKRRHEMRSKWLTEIGPSMPHSRSVLVMAGANAWLAGLETSDDVGVGIVSAVEIALLDLDGTELVFLSACEGGIGLVDSRDGSLVSLRTAALLAGAECCVAALWEVDDAITNKLVLQFYNQVIQGISKAEALRNAKLRIREEHPHPYFWAGWILDGSAATTPESPT
ncbi:MAG: CHAT domain-containing protein [Rhodopirellula sp.]|nr:CHAT domain-containing protein [Rhodopirellula sp.]